MKQTFTVVKKEAVEPITNQVTVGGFFVTLLHSANDRDVEYLDENLNEWVCMDMAHHFKRKFRLKPRTITINGIEVPAPFKPKEGETYWCFSTQTVLGYGHNVYESERADRRFINMGAWRTEEEIKQVVAALRQVFGANQ